MPLLGDDLLLALDMAGLDALVGGVSMTNENGVTFQSGAGALGDYAEFDGATSERKLRLSAANLASVGATPGDRDLTVALWVRFNVVNAVQNIWGISNAAIDERGMTALLLSTGVVRFSISTDGTSGGNVTQDSSHAALSADTFYLLSMRFNAAGNTLRVGVNSTFNSVSAAAINDSTADLTFGGTHDSTGAFLDGDVGYFYFFDRNLTDDEIISLVAGGAGREPTAGGVFPLTARVDTVGSGGAFATLVAWRDARKVNVVQQNAYAIADVLDGTVGALTTTTGWGAEPRDVLSDPTANRTLTIRAAAGSKHAGKYATGAGVARINHGASVGLVVGTPNLVIEGLVFTSTGASSVTASAAGVVVKDCISDGANNAFAASNVTMRVQNSIAHGGSNCLDVQNASGVLNVYFCTLTCTTGNVFNVGTGATLNENGNYGHSASGAVYAGAGTINKGAASATSNTEAATAELDSIAFDTTTFENVTDGTEDYHLATGSPLVNVGPNAAALGITRDLVGLQRPQGDESDIGALETPLATAGAKNLLLLGVG